MSEPNPSFSVLCTSAKRFWLQNILDSSLSLTKLALLYENQGKYEQAETLNKRALVN